MMHLARMHRGISTLVSRCMCWDISRCAACGIAIRIAIHRSRYDARIAGPSIAMHRCIDVSLHSRWSHFAQRAEMRKEQRCAKSRDAQRAEMRKEQRCAKSRDAQRAEMCKEQRCAKSRDVQRAEMCNYYT